MGNKRVSITLGKPAIRFGRSNCAADKPQAPHRRSASLQGPFVTIRESRIASRRSFYGV